MRVFIGEFRQESNSFNPVTSSIAFWDKSGRYEGEAVRRAFAGKPCAIGGMIQGVEESGGECDIVFGVAMSCQSGGPADQEVMDLFLEKTLPSLEKNGPFDLVLLSFHGALQTTRFDDAEGEIAERVRRVIGDKAVISVSTDLHAFISEKLLANVDAIAGYHTYPHVDHFETGRRAAGLGLAALAGNGGRPHTACAQLPLMVAASAYNTMEGVFREIMDDCHALVEAGTLMDFSVYPVQPWLDVEGGMSSVLAVAADPAEAEKHARDIAARIWRERHRFVKPLLSIDEVIELAKKTSPGNPVILVDSADSCNAGASGDSMAVAARILARAPGIKSATIVNDTRAADAAHSLGVGKKAVFKIGGGRDRNAEAIEAEGYVRSLHDGVFVQEGPAGRGLVSDIGPTAVIRFGNLDVVVCHWMASSGDPQLYRAFGIEPTLYDLVVVKACTSFRAGYSKLSTRIHETDTPGAATADLTRLEYKKIPKTHFPWTDSETPECGGIRFCRGG